MTPAAINPVLMTGLLQNIQGLRGVAILLVLFVHIGSAVAWFGRWDGAPQWLNVGLSGVDIFFVISGFIMATIVSGEFRKPGSVVTFLFARAARIYPVYVLVSLAFLASHDAFPPAISQHWQNRDVMRSLLLLPQDELPVLVVGWTLEHEMYFYVVTGLLLLLPERFFIHAVILWGVAATVAGLAVGAVGPTVGHITHPLTLEFVAGCLIARLIQAGYRQYAVLALIAGTVLLPAGYCTFALGEIPDGWLRVALFGVPATLIVYGACGMEVTHTLRFPRWLRFIGDISYSLYLTHVPIILAVALAWSKSPGARETPAVGAILMSVATIATGIATYYLLELPLHKVARRMKQRMASRWNS